MFNTRLAKITLVLSATSALLAALCMPFAGFTLDRTGFWQSTSPILVLAVMFVVMQVISTRLANDESTLGRRLRYVARSVIYVAWTSGFIMVMTAAMIILNYFAMTVALPLQDAAFARADELIGFNWLATLEWVNNRPVIAKILTMSYHTTINQMIVVVLVLGALHQFREMQEFAALYTMTAIAVLILSALLPAIGAYPYYNPPAEMYANMSAKSGRWHLEQLTALREGTFTLLNIKKAEGLVTFPSFHTILAILVTYAFRHVRAVFWPVLVLNSLIIISTLPEGGHYLIDVYIGAAIAVASIVFVRRWCGTTSPWMQPYLWRVDPPRMPSFLRSAS